MTITFRGSRMEDLTRENIELETDYNKRKKIEAYCSCK